MSKGILFTSEIQLFRKLGIVDEVKPGSDQRRVVVPTDFSPSLPVPIFTSRIPREG